MNAPEYKEAIKRIEFLMDIDNNSTIREELLRLSIETSNYECDNFPMEEKMKTNGKMKTVGYICIGFAALITCAVIFGLAPEIPAAKELIGTWLVTGVSLLTVNAGKRIAGGIAMSRQGQ